MIHQLLHTSMLNLVTAATPCVLLAINSLGIITHVHGSQEFAREFELFVDKELLDLLSAMTGIDTADVIFAEYQNVFKSSGRSELLNLHYINSEGQNKQFDIHFAHVHSSDYVITLICDTSRNAMLEAEYRALLHQYEAVQEKLATAMSTLDFRMADVDAAHKKIAALFRIVAILQKPLDEQSVLEEILDASCGFGYSHAAVFLLDRISAFKPAAIRGQFENDREMELMGREIVAYAAQQQLLTYADKDKRYFCLVEGAPVDIAREIAVPLMSGDRLVAVLYVRVEAELVIQSADLSLLQTVAGPIGAVVAQARYVTAIEQQAITDAMTGLHNYRYFCTVLRQEIKRSLRYRRPLVMLMLDIDYFKKYNDANGHVMGDKILLMTANIMKRTCRDTDYVFRYGGEEFAILLPETTVSEGYELAERIRKNIADYAFPQAESQPQGRLTISIGIAGFPVDASNDIGLVNCADMALYMAKKTRNAVSIYQDNETFSIENL